LVPTVVFESRSSGLADAPDGGPAVFNPSVDGIRRSGQTDKWLIKIDHKAPGETDCAFNLKVDNSAAVEPGPHARKLL
jgi:hypothetical protein